MNIPEIAKCPACKCDVAYSEELKTMQCQVCPYDAGGDNETEADAFAVHERICRQPTPEAADTGFIVTYRTGSIVILRDRGPDSFELREAKSIEPITFAAHPPKPEPTEVVEPSIYLYQKKDEYPILASSRDEHLEKQGYEAMPLYTQPTVAAPKPPVEWMEAAVGYIREKDLKLLSDMKYAAVSLYNYKIDDWTVPLFKHAPKVPEGGK